MRCASLVAFVVASVLKGTGMNAINLSCKFLRGQLLAKLASWLFHEARYEKGYEKGTFSILFGLIVAERGFAGNGLSWEGGELVNVEEPCSRRGFE